MTSITRSLKQEELVQLLLDPKADTVKMPWLNAAKIAANASLLKQPSASNDALTQEEATDFAKRAAAAYSESVPTIDPWDMENILKTTQESLQGVNTPTQNLKDELSKGYEAVEKYLEYPTTESSIRNLKPSEPVWHEGMFICW